LKVSYFWELWAGGKMLEPRGLPKGLLSKGRVENLECGQPRTDCFNTTPEGRRGFRDQEFDVPGRIALASDEEEQSAKTLRTIKPIKTETWDKFFCILFATVKKVENGRFAARFIRPMIARHWRQGATKVGVRKDKGARLRR
jgi:hypothetical protein